MPRERGGCHALAGSEAGRQRARRLLSRAALLCGAAAAGWLLLGFNSSAASAAPADSAGSGVHPATTESIGAPAPGDAGPSTPSLLGLSLNGIEPSLGQADENSSSSTFSHSSPTTGSHLSSLSKSNIIVAKSTATQGISDTSAIIVSNAGNGAKQNQEIHETAVGAHRPAAGRASSHPVIGSSADATPVAPASSETPRTAPTRDAGDEHAATSSVGSSDSDANAALPLPLVDQLLDPADPLGSITAPILDPVAAALAPVTTVAEPLVTPLAAVAAPITTPAEKLVADVTGSISPVTAPLASVLSPLTQQVGETLAPVTQTVQSVTESAEPALDAVEPLIADVAQAVEPVSTTLHPMTQTVSDDVLTPITEIADPAVSHVARNATLPVSQLITTNHGLANNQSAVAPKPAFTAMSASLATGLSTIAPNDSVIRSTATAVTPVFSPPIVAPQQQSPEASINLIGLSTGPALAAPRQPASISPHSGLAAVQVDQPALSTSPLVAPLATTHVASGAETDSPAQGHGSLPAPEPTPVGGAGGAGTSNSPGNAGPGSGGASAADLADSWAAAPAGSEAQRLDNVSSPKNDGKKPPVSPA